MSVIVERLVIGPINICKTRQYLLNASEMNYRMLYIYTRREFHYLLFKYNMCL